MPKKYCCPYSKDELYHLFVEEEKTIDEMCSILGVSRNTVSKVLRNVGINTDVSGRTFEKVKNGMSDNEFRDFLKSKYINEKKSCLIIGEELGISAATVNNYLRKYGIKSRERGEMTPKKWEKIVTVRDKIGLTDEEFKEYLVKEYESGRSMNDVALELGISAAGVRKYFVKYDIARRSSADYLPKLNRRINWKGGRRITNHGYIEIYCPNHPYANKRNCVYEHQLIVEDYIGRFLNKDEVVHHIDGNKQNNNISNLLLLSNSEHVRLHAILNSSKKRMKVRERR